MTDNAFKQALSGIQKQVPVKTLDGEKLYTFRLLKMREAHRIYHKTVSVILAAIAHAAGGEGPAAKLEAIRALDFDTLWDLARSLLCGCKIIPNPENPDMFVIIDDMDTCHYFESEPEELYIAIYHALKVNYPKSWGRVEKVLSDFGPRLEALVGATSSIASAPSSSRPATSQPSSKSAPKKS